MPWGRRYFGSSEGCSIDSLCRSTSTISLVAPSGVDASIQLSVFCHWQGARILTVGPTGLLLGRSCPVLIALKSELTRWQPDRSEAVVRTPVFLSTASMAFPANEWDQGQSWATFLSGGSIWLCMTEAGRTWTHGISQDLPIMPLYAWESWGFTPHIIHKRCMNTSLGERALGTVWHLPSILTLALVHTWLTISSENKYAGLRVFRGSTFQLLWLWLPTCAEQDRHPAGLVTVPLLCYVGFCQVSAGEWLYNTGEESMQECFDSWKHQLTFQDRWWLPYLGPSLGPCKIHFENQASVQHLGY